MKIATWNVNSIKVRLEQVLQWLQDTDVDVLCLQELKLDTPLFELSKFSDIGYPYVAVNGQKTYNGVAIVSKHPLADVVLDIPEFVDEQKRVIAATVNGVRVINCYFVNGEALDSPKYQYKLSWLSALELYVKSQISSHKSLILLGDYNIAPEDRDTYDPKIWAGKILCSPAERASFEFLINMGLTDMLRNFYQDKNDLFTWWDYRNFGFKRKLGIRIDHILVTSDILAKSISCQVDTAPRKLERPSDHAPVVLEYK